MSTLKPTYDGPARALDGDKVAHDRSRALLGQVMVYVAVTVGLAALGAYLGRDLDGAIGLVLLVATIPVVVALNIGRTLFSALLGLIAFGIAAIFVSIPRRECHLRRRGPRDLRRVHDLRLQPPSPQHP